VFSNVTSFQVVEIGNNIFFCHDKEAEGKYAVKLHLLLTPQTLNTQNRLKIRRRHLERMEKDRMPKKIFTQELEGTRRRGRPRKRWTEEVERDLQVLGVRRWRELVADRKKWKDIVRQAKAHSGL